VNLGDADYQLVEKSLGDAVDDAAQRWAGRIGWVFGDVVVSFAAMKEAADRVARALLACGIERGDVVAVWTSNVPEFAQLQFACAKVGAVIGAINTRSKVFEVEHFLRHSEAKLLVMMDRFLKEDFVSILDQVCAPASRGPLGDVDDVTLPGLRKIVSLTHPPARDAMPWADFIACGERVAPQALVRAQADQRIDDAILIQYTSGTTSAPKGALCNHRYVLNFGGALLHRLGVGEGDTFLNTQPFYHVGGSCGAIPAPLTMGCKVVSAEYYEVERILGLIQRERCTARSGYGAMYIMEMNHPRYRDFDLSSLKAGWCVGPPELMDRVRAEMGIPGLLQIYGATEAGGTSARVSDSWSVRSRSCGTPVAGTEVRIVDPATGNALPPGRVGEICMRGWWKMNGYFRQSAESAGVTDGEGWVHSGDLGYVDESNHLFFSGRLKDMLKIGGENVSALEVETVLLSHPGVEQACVIGAPDDRLSEVVMAIVQIRRGVDLGEAEIIAYCRQRMANFRVPRYVRFTREWPLTDSGKIQKHKLREMFLVHPP